MHAASSEISAAASVVTTSTPAPSVALSRRCRPLRRAAAAQRRSLAVSRRRVIPPWLTPQRPAPVVCWLRSRALPAGDARYAGALVPAGVDLRLGPLGQLAPPAAAQGASSCICCLLAPAHPCPQPVAHRCAAAWWGESAQARAARETPCASAGAAASALFSAVLSQASTTKQSPWLQMRASHQLHAQLMPRPSLIIHPRRTCRTPPAPSTHRSGPRSAPPPRPPPPPPPPSPTCRKRTCGSSSSSATPWRRSGLS